jgi:hypothetical protein
MRLADHVLRVAASTVAFAVAAFSFAQAASSQPPTVGQDDVVVVAAGPQLAAGRLHRILLGDNYRDLWTTPIRVAVLDLEHFAGGIRPTRIAGGKQTRSLRFITRDSVTYAFREIFKSRVDLPDVYRRSLMWRIFRDAGSALNPAATVAAVPVMRAVSVFHAEPQLVVMPDDPLLGEFRAEFAGLLGTIELYPRVPRAGPAFANSVEILDGTQLLDAINRHPANRVDARTMLKARLTDLLLGDNDRHADQWRWARRSVGGVFEPIARDRDRVFVSYEGLIIGIARRTFPFLVTYRPMYADPLSMFQNTASFDRRILSELDRSTWESVAAEIKRDVTDDVIEQTIEAMPREYRSRSAGHAATLRARRDRLSEAALRYYAELWPVADIHGTDANDRATVTRLSDGSVDVTLQLGSEAPWFHRQFHPDVTREIRLYLHGGDDVAVVNGVASRSIPVRVIGGNGTNSLTDLSVVGGKRNTTLLYDQGTVNCVVYAPDTVAEDLDYSNALNSYYNRRPWVHAFGRLVPPPRDFGSSSTFALGLKSGYGLGLVPRIGSERRKHGFRAVPYASLATADIAMSTATRGLKATAQYERRFESSDFHVPVDAQVSQLEMIRFQGFGNDVAEGRGRFFGLRQTAWEFHPAAGYLFAPESDLTLGPVIRYTTTDSTANRFISQLGPYGFTKFAQAGLQIALHVEGHVLPDTTKPRALFDLSGAAYPGIGDARTAYQTIESSARAFVTLPLPKRPVIGLHAGGKKNFGNVPYFDAAFIGGANTFRTENTQRYAGDASLYGSLELRYPLAKVPMILPLDIGALAFSDAARVYVDGDSPGGWHTAAGAGFWIGAVDAGKNVNVLFTNRSGRRVIVNLGFAY